MTNPTLDLLHRHGSVRKYLADPVPAALIEQIVHAAQRASTSSNMQVVSVVAVTEAAKRKRLSEVCGQEHVAQAPVVLGILGEDPFGEGIQQAIRDQTAHGRGFEIKRAKDFQNMGRCHLLFISPSEKGRLPEILARLGKTPTLTVSDLEEFARQGGMVGFYKESGKLRFEINTRAAEQTGLKISSRLLQLARIVREGG